jgi:hypothetical protein
LRAAPAPVALDVLAGHLGTVRLPARTTALLDRVGTGGPPRRVWSDPDAVDSSVAREPVPLEALVVELLAERLTRLLDGLFEVTEPPNITPLARALSGLGPGLTPTGDDLLVGIAAACRRLVAGESWPATRGDVLSAALAEMGDTGTTAVAREMVGRAALGQFPEVLTGFVELLGDRNVRPDHVQAAAGRLAAIGAHSGADMLAGVVALAARACREREAG